MNTYTSSFKCSSCNDFIESSHWKGNELCVGCQSWFLHKLQLPEITTLDAWFAHPKEEYRKFLVSHGTPIDVARIQAYFSSFMKKTYPDCFSSKKLTYLSTDF